MTTRHYVPLSGSPDWAAGVMASKKLMLGEQRRSMGNALFRNYGAVGKVWVEGDDIALLFSRGGTSIHSSPVLLSVAVSGKKDAVTASEFADDVPALLRAMRKLASRGYAGYFYALARTVAADKLQTDEYTKVRALVNDNQNNYYIVTEQDVEGVSSYVKSFYPDKYEYCGPAREMLAARKSLVDYYGGGYVTVSDLSSTLTSNVIPYNTSTYLWDFEISYGTYVEGPSGTFTVPGTGVTVTGHTTAKTIYATRASTPCITGDIARIITDHGVNKLLFNGVVIGGDALGSGESVVTDGSVSSSDITVTATSHYRRRYVALLTWQDEYNPRTDVYETHSYVTGMRFEAEGFVSEQNGYGSIAPGEEDSGWGTYGYNAQALYNPVWTDLPYDQFLPEGKLIFGEQGAWWKADLCGAGYIGSSDGSDKFVFFGAAVEQSEDEVKSVATSFISGDESLFAKATATMKKVFREADTIAGAVEIIYI